MSGVFITKIAYYYYMKRYINKHKNEPALQKRGNYYHTIWVHNRELAIKKVLYDSSDLGLTQIMNLIQTKNVIYVMDLLAKLIEEGSVKKRIRGNQKVYYVDKPTFTYEKRKSRYNLRTIA